MSQNKTVITDVPVQDFIRAVEPPRKRDDATALDAIFRDVTGFEPVMWGPTIIGYGQYHYRYASGRESDFLATGFSPRKANISIYIMPGYGDFEDILADLGKHKIGKSCLYINKLADVDTDVLKHLIRSGLDRLETFWPVQPT
jgi:hypothetical protein